MLAQQYAQHVIDVYVRWQPALQRHELEGNARLHVAVQISDADIIGSGGYVSQAQCVNTLQQLHQTLGKLQAGILSHGPSNTLEHHCGSLPSSIQLIPACTAAFFCGTAISVYVRLTSRHIDHWIRNGKE